MCFCRCGTSSSGQSMPRSPRATISASATSVIAASSASAALVSILATMPARSPTTSRSLTTSAARRTNDRATYSTPAAATASASTRSSSVGANICSRSHDRCTPGPALRAAAALDLGDHGVVGHGRPRAARCRRRRARRGRRDRGPSSSVGIVDGDDLGALLGAGPGTRRTRSPGARSTPRRGTPPARIFGPGRSASTPTGRPTRRGDVADRRQAREVLVDRAVAEVEADDVDAGAHHRLEPRRVVAGRSERGDDLRAAGHTCLSSRSMELVLARHSTMADRPWLTSTPTAALRAHLDASPSPWHAVRTSARPSRPPASPTSTSGRRGPTSPTPATSTAAGRSIAWRRPAGGGPLPVRTSSAPTPTRPACGSSRIPTAARAGWRQLGVEIYGGVLLNSWLDRDLGIAGRLVFADGSDTLVDVAEPIARVPQLAIHLDRDVNERGLVLDRQAHMTPVWATAATRRSTDVDRRAGRRPPSRPAWELCLYDVQPAACSAPTTRCWPAAASTTWCRAGRRRRRWSPPRRPTTSR